MKFDIALVNKAFQKSFAPMKNIVALVHMVVIALGAWLLMQLGMQLAIAVQSQIVVYVFMGITVIYAVVVFSSMAYFLYFFGLASVKSDKKAGLGDAISALKSQPVTALIFILCFIAVLLLEAFLLWLLSLIPEVGYIIIVLLFLPLLVLNFVLWSFLFFGGILCYPTMIDQKKGIAGVIKNVAVIIKQRFAKLVLFHLFQTVALLLVGLLLYVVLSLAAQIPLLFASPGQLGGAPMGGNIFGLIGADPFRIIGMAMMFFNSGSVLYVILGVILLIYCTVIFGLLLSFLLNFSCSLVAGFYLHVKDEVDFSDDLGLKKLNIDIK